jgi:hypothetical protein
MPEDANATIERTVAPNSYKTIWADPNAPRPSGRYITLKITSFLGVGDANKSLANGSGIITIERNIEFTVSIQGFRSGANSTLADILFACDKQANMIGLNNSGVAYCNILNGVTDLTALIDANWEERASLDIRFRSSFSQTSDTGFIESASVNGSYT